MYSNLTRAGALDAVSQLCVADITYVRRARQFVYVAVILDAFSRRVIGWTLGETLEAELTLAALRMALHERKPQPGLVHHSDCDVQYASRNYTTMLAGHGMVISMSQGQPVRQPTAESFMKTLKYEEVYRSEYRDVNEARASIGRFLEQI